MVTATSRVPKYSTQDTTVETLVNAAALLWKAVTESCPNMTAGECALIPGAIESGMVSTEGWAKLTVQSVDTIVLKGYGNVKNQT